MTIHQRKTVVAAGLEKTTDDSSASYSSTSWLHSSSSLSLSPVPSSPPSSPSSPSKQLRRRGSSSADAGLECPAFPSLLPPKVPSGGQRRSGGGAIKDEASTEPKDRPSSSSSSSPCRAALIAGGSVLTLALVVTLAAMSSWGGSVSSMSDKIIGLTDQISTLRSVETGLTLELIEERERLAKITTREEEERETIRVRDRELERMRMEMKKLREENDALERKERDERDELMRRGDEIERLREEIGTRKSREGKMRGEGTRRERYRLEDDLWVEIAEVREMSKKAVTEKFGPNQHRVRLQLEFPEDDAPPADYSDEHYIVIETAPLDVMPHAVLVFLEQVSQGLWDGTSFYRSGGGGAVVAGPRSMADKGEEHDEDGEGAEGAMMARKFEEKGLYRLLYPEYDEEGQWPHDNKWTVAFRNSPEGSPSFYVNTENNEGRTGSDKNDNEREEPDSPFGRIVAGQGVIKRIGRMEKEEGKGGELKRYVKIESAKIMAG